MIVIIRCLSVNLFFLIFLNETYSPGKAGSTQRIFILAFPYLLAHMEISIHLISVDNDLLPNGDLNRTVYKDLFDNISVISVHKKMSVCGDFKK